MPIRTGPGFSATRQSSAATSEYSTDRGNSRSRSRNSATTAGSATQPCVRMNDSYAPQACSSSGPLSSGGPGMRASSSRAVMSARSSDRPSTKNRQVSSWLMVESARPKNSAARSLMNRRNTCGPSRSAARRWPVSP